jgi:hypothetical protein
MTIEEFEALVELKFRELGHPGLGGGCCPLGLMMPPGPDDHYPPKPFPSYAHELSGLPRLYCCGVSSGWDFPHYEPEGKKAESEEWKRGRELGLRLRERKLAES